MPGSRAPFVPVDHDPPVDRLNDDVRSGSRPGRRLESYNPGVPTAGYRSPLRRGESIGASPEDAARMKLAEDERVRVVSRRGAVDAPVRVDEALRPGLAFMPLYFQDEVAMNVLTIDSTDPRSGTVVKATAVRIEKVRLR